MQPAYTCPSVIQLAMLQTLLKDTKRILDDSYKTLLPIQYAGDLSLLDRPSVALVGARAVSSDGAKRARHLARQLAKAGVVVVSGLAEGVDTEALTAAIEAGGQVIAVIGTPLDQAYPVTNGPLQQTIAREHLIFSQFAIGTPVERANFPLRNRTMAAISDGTCVIEASDKSGTLHQMAECTKLGRWVFLLRSLAENDALEWPRRIVKYPKTVVVSQAEDILTRLR